MANGQRESSELIDKLYRLQVGVVGTGEGRHERPHKPIMLLAALDTLDRRHGTTERIAWDAALLARNERRS